jgi:hypothetical protein
MEAGLAMIDKTKSRRAHNAALLEILKLQKWTITAPSAIECIFQPIGIANGQNTFN